jgi:CBS domain-containing protein
MAVDRVTDVRAPLPAGRSLDEIRVAEAMHPGVYSLPTGSSLRDAALIMATHRVHCVVVVGGDQEADVDLEGRLWGVVSDLDLVSAAAAGDVGERTAASAAVTPVIVVSPDDTLTRAAGLMREHRVTHLVVARRASQYPLGVLSTLDIARAVA